mmetsp:Transcript_67622/g.153014  ORF Transcript_67622/g.153014 Transcript_67622/m.153014 type:complete len:229 (-) Transcript_67622:696-1382(-)
MRKGGLKAPPVPSFPVGFQGRDAALRGRPQQKRGRHPPSLGPHLGADDPVHRRREAVVGESLQLVAHQDHHPRGSGTSGGAPTPICPGGHGASLGLVAALGVLPPGGGEHLEAGHACARDQREPSPIGVRAERNVVAVAVGTLFINAASTLFTLFGEIASEAVNRCRRLALDQILREIHEVAHGATFLGTCERGRRECRAQRGVAHREERALTRDDHGAAAGAHIVEA